MLWVLLAVVVVLLVIIGVLVARQQRSRRLKDAFGPEYRRVVASGATSASPRRSWPIAVSESVSSRFDRSIPQLASAIWRNGRRPSATSWMSR